ncbi:MAG TPA: L-fucose/L-arabinose isomerase family protein [Pirellulales bacterium]|jgi:L-fucose isomerase-like protein|nr:L-fucose/L-arabinose isomerase family protein [Pirellulales bacterium]
MNTLGLIVGNRGFFPDHLCATGREAVLKVLAAQDINVVALPTDATKFGVVESLEDARKCADLFRANAEKIDGVLVTLPNFGDERAVANTLRWANLGVPVLVHAFDDVPGTMTIKDRRDAFCGKMSACNNLRQYNIPYSLTGLHTVDPARPEFTEDVRRFTATCRVVKKFKNARVGAIGARPGAFNTVRYSEKILEHHGITTETLDLSEVLGWTRKLADDDPAVKAKMAAIKSYTNTANVPEGPLVKMAKLGVVIEKWSNEQQLIGTAIQCWTSLEEFYGVVPCTIMSMSSNSLIPSACETDVTGLIGMLALTAAAGKPAALLDWNNNYGTDPNMGVVFHCSNLPKDFFSSQKMDYQEIIAGTVGKENTFGTIVGKIAPGPFTYCRVSTDDLTGKIRTYVGEGTFTDDKLNTFGGYGTFRVERLQELLQFICRNGFEHHVAATKVSVGEAVYDAMSTYLKWDVYRHV